MFQRFVGTILLSAHFYQFLCIFFNIIHIRIRLADFCVNIYARQVLAVVPYFEHFKLLTYSKHRNVIAVSI